MTIGMQPFCTNCGEPVAKNKVFGDKGGRSNGVVACPEDGQEHPVEWRDT